MWDRYTIRRKILSFARRAGWTWAPVRPVILAVAITSRCNLSCRICPVHGPSRPASADFSDDMKPEVYERLRNDLLPTAREIAVCGVGEPFLSPMFYRLLDDTLAAGKRVSVVTNGTILNQKYLEWMVRSPSIIRVSLDGTTPDVMEHIRPGAGLDRVLAFIEAIKQLRERVGHPTFGLEINFVVTRSNLEQMADCVDLASRYGVNTIYFTNFVTAGRTDAFALESLKDSPEVVLPHWERAHRRGGELGIEVRRIFFDCFDRPVEEQLRYRPSLYDSRGQIRQCPVPWWSTYIGPDGTVRPCCCFWTDTKMGNLLERPFSKIWNSAPYRELRRTVNTPNMPHPCRRCMLEARF